MMADYHVHTHLCKHARGRPVEYVESAKKNRITEICFTDHIPCPDGYDPENRMILSQFPTYRQEVAAAASAHPDVTVLFGMEADYYETMDPLQPGWIAAQNFDLVLGSVHVIKEWAFDDPLRVQMWDKVDITGAWKEYFRLLGELVDLRCFDIIAHFDLPKKFGYRPKDSVVREMALPVLDKVAAAGMGIELNSSGLRKPVKEIYPSPDLLTLARERNIPITFGSDSHMPEEVGYEFSKSLSLAKSVGYTRRAVFRGRQKQLVSLP